MGAQIRQAGEVMNLKPHIAPVMGDLSTRQERIAVLLLLLASVFFIELILFKFIPDIGGATLYPNAQSAFVSMEAFKNHFMEPFSVHYSRFLGNIILYELAQAIGHFVHFSDIRLTPLRIAAGILTPIYFLIGASPLYFLRHLLDWRVFLAAYVIMFMSGMYVFYPCDAPALAMLSLGLAALLVQNLPVTLVFLLLTGLFRESAFHFVVLGAVWALTSRAKPLPHRILWLAAFTVAFAVEYKLIRHFYPGPLNPPGLSGGISAEDILFGHGMWSLTTIVSLGMALLFPVAYLALNDRKYPGWERKFFTLNCLAFPFWIIFYRIMGGNISEFRMLWPALIPCVFGLAWRSPILEKEN